MFFHLNFMQIQTMHTLFNISPYVSQNIKPILWSFNGTIKLRQAIIESEYIPG